MISTLNEESSICSSSLCVFCTGWIFAFFIGLYLGRLYHIYRQKQNCYRVVLKGIQEFIKFGSSISPSISAFMNLSEEQSTIMYDMVMHVLNAESPQENFFNLLLDAVVREQNKAATRSMDKGARKGGEQRGDEFFFPESTK